MKKLYKFKTLGFGLAYTVDGLFVAEEADVEAAIGKNVFFGESSSYGGDSGSSSSSN